MIKIKHGSILSAIITCCLFVFPAITDAQLGCFTKEDLIKFTPEWNGERFADGRPKVPDDILERMKLVEIEEAWSVCQRAGYIYQFVDGWYNLHPDRVLVGRAVTGTFIPHRPDVHKVTQEIGEAQGRVQTGGQNSWVIDSLVKDDVIVIDLFGKIEQGTYAGGNLANSIYSKTGTGMVIDGAVRDLGQISQIPDFNAYIRGADPTGIGGVTLAGINVPTRIGRAICMPGDVVLGGIEGIIFIPAHLAEEVVTRSEIVRMRDMFGFQRLHEGVYTPGEIDSRWSDEMEKDFTRWIKENMDNLPVPKKQILEYLKTRE